MGELIAAHENVKYIYEAHEVWEIGGQGESDSHRLIETHATPEVVRQIREWFEKQNGERMIVEKCPRNTLRVPYVHRIFPEAKILNIVRDGRDVACSLRPGIGGEEWRHLKPENWKELVRLPWLERCARVWMESVNLAENELAGLDHLRIKYEDLVADPQEMASRILEYLALPPSQGVAEFCKKIQDPTDGSYMADNYSRKWNTLDHARRIGRWRENLTSAEQEFVQSLLSDTLTRFGYVVE